MKADRADNGAGADGAHCQSERGFPECPIQSVKTMQPGRQMPPAEEQHQCETRTGCGWKKCRPTTQWPAAESQKVNRVRDENRCCKCGHAGHFRSEEHTSELQS